MSDLAQYELDFLKRIEIIVSACPSCLTPKSEEFWRRSLLDFSNSLIDVLYNVKSLNNEHLKF